MFEPLKIVRKKKKNTIKCMLMYLYKLRKNTYMVKQYMLYSCNKMVKTYLLTKACDLTLDNTHFYKQSEAPCLFSTCPL